MSWPEIIALASLPAFLLIDFFYPPRGVRAQWWRSRAVVITVFNFWLALFIGQAWGEWMGDVHLLNGAALGTVGGTLVGVVVYEFFHYWYHRSA